MVCVIELLSKNQVFCLCDHAWAFLGGGFTGSTPQINALLLKTKYVEKYDHFQWKTPKT